MEINCTITRDDCWQFSKYVMLHHPAYRRGPVIRLLVFALCWGFVARTLNASWVFVAVTTPVSTALVAAAVVWRLRAFVMRIPSERGSMLGEHYVAIGRDGVVRRTKCAQSLVHWSGILDIAENKRYLFLFVDAHLAIIVPKRAFERKEEAQAFLDAARSYWQETKSQPPPVDRYGYPLIGR